MPVSEVEELTISAFLLVRFHCNPERRSFLMLFARGLMLSEFFALTTSSLPLHTGGSSSLPDLLVR